ncbi:MAG: hypothetical protein IJM37_10325 [Lachnospiraceae bacterium]|nr:hypothetical protein [Lachnospiraceae bacterium]
MKNKIYILVVIIFIFVLSACTVKYDITKTSAKVIIVGRHDNSVDFDIPVEETAIDGYTNYGNVAFVIVDGTPEVMKNYDENIGYIGVVGYNDINDFLDSEKHRKSEEFWEKKRLNPYVEDTKKLFDAYEPNDDETDVLQAIKVAQSMLSTVEEPIKESGVLKEGEEKLVKKEIIIYETGLSTSGVVNFQDREWQDLLFGKDILKDETQKKKLKEKINEMVDNYELPDLKDVIIEWYGMGAVDKPQDKLSGLMVHNLEYIWESILTASGVKDKDIQMRDIHSEPSEKDFECNVTVIELPKEIPVESTEESVEETKEDGTIEIITIEFENETDDYKDEVTANLNLTESANNLMKYNGNNDKKNILVGTTSSHDGGSVALSEERAKKVMNDLIAKGVDGSLLSFVGLGYYSSQSDITWCINDKDSNNNLIEVKARENRKVWIIDANSPRGKDACKIAEEIHR